MSDTHNLIAMMFRIKPIHKTNKSILGTLKSPLIKGYSVQFKVNWYHRWRFITNRQSHKQITVWKHQYGAQTYINQEKKRLNIK